MPTPKARIAREHEGSYAQLRITAFLLAQVFAAHGAAWPPISGSGRATSLLSWGPASLLCSMRERNCLAAFLA